MFLTRQTCKCGAVYQRMGNAELRTLSSFDCIGCGEIIETFTGIRMPRYRLIRAPIRSMLSPKQKAQPHISVKELNQAPDT